MNTALNELKETVTDALGSSILETQMALDELSIVIKRDDVVRVLKHLRDDVNCHFKILLDLCGVDYPEREERFEVVYHLLSLTHNRRIVTRTWRLSGAFFAIFLLSFTA